MAQGDKFQMAIAYPIMNPNFSLPNRAQGTLDIAYTTGTNLSTNGVTPDQGGVNLDFLDLVFKENKDRIKIGPSSNNTDLNKSESPLITGFAGSDKDFTIAAALDFDYEINDKWFGLGSALASGWYIKNDTGSPMNSDTFTDIVLGNFDNYAQRFEVSNDVTGDFVLLKQDLDPDFLEDSTVYRVGLVYKFIDASTAGRFSIQVGDVITLISIEKTNFTTFSQIGLRTWGSAPGFHIRLKTPGADATKKLTITIDEVFLEHTFGDFASRRTIIPITNSGYTNGYYEFDENPDLRSVKVIKREVFEELMYANNKKVWHDSSGLGDRTEKYSFGCRFSDVTQSFYDVLLEFERLQKEGHSINIHPHVDNLPSVLRGQFKISGLEKNSWDLSLRSFNFEFAEA